ncbi:hypothetical protein IQ259_04400 [Fortiea sp. LEGE XX443]|uniref:hypothetical protein n=1 Tax=Fortiea sp. LEGE XX443 TaxID=1828611 RepID=UPI0018829FBA|nr:hypothetical protein [Fortiea sp. LEGE XX443]MBE9004287.1 hypothetical protein [Fortiea sp. LEGE XX443]
MNSFHQTQNKLFGIILATASLLTGIVGTSSSAIAAPLLSTQLSAVNSKMIANAYSCPWHAGGGRLEAYIETTNFYIHICNKRGKLFYTGISKLNRQGIRSLRAYTEEGTGYVAKNKEYEYIVNGASLDIVKNGKVVQTDPVIKYVSGYSN